MEAILLGKRFTGEEAVKAGIVYACCPPDKLMDMALKVIKKVVPPGGFKRSTVSIMKTHTYKSVIDLKFVKDVNIPSFL